MWLACLVLALQPAVSAPTPPLDAAAALKLLQGSTSFGTRSGRTKLRIARLEPVEEAEKHRWYLVAMEWTAVGAPPEGDRAEIGVAVVKRLDDLDVDERVYGLDGGPPGVDPADAPCPASCTPIE